MATRPRASSLNPCAASYIPLSKRQVDNKTCETGKAPKIGIEVDPFGTPDQTQSQKILSSNISKISTGHVSYSSTSYNMNEVMDKRMMDEEFDMDLEYLQMTFPGLSNKSVTDVYLANGGDLEATIDMLNHLELDAVYSESLPETLDIGDFSESGYLGGVVSHKTRNLSNGASASSSNWNHPPSLD